MAMPYLPPHRHHPNGRDEIPQQTSMPSTEPSYTSKAINDHFATQSQGTLGAPLGSNTISRILVFAQHPEYPPKIFVKTNLDLVFEDNGKGSVRGDILQSTFRVPLFEQKTTRKRAHASPFEFAGWVNIKKVDRLRSHSQELIDMLAAKFQRYQPKRSWDIQNNMENNHQSAIPSLSPASTHDRTDTAWKTSLDVDWAVVTLARVEECLDNPMEEPVLPMKKMSIAEDEQDFDGSNDTTPPGRNISSVTLKAFMLQDINPEQPSPSVHSELIDSISSLAPSLILSPLDVDSSDENIKASHVDHMVDSLTSELDGVSIVDSDHNGINDDDVDDDDDKWSELSGGHEKAWTVVENKE